MLFTVVFFFSIKDRASLYRKHLPIFRRQIIVLKCLSPWKMNESSSYHSDAFSNILTVLLQVFRLCTVAKDFLATFSFWIQKVLIFSFSDCFCRQKYQLMQKLDRKCIQQTCVASTGQNLNKEDWVLWANLRNIGCTVNSVSYSVSTYLLSILIDTANFNKWRVRPQQNTIKVRRT